MPTYRMHIEYLGTEWHGWQIQPDAPSVQGAIENALETALRYPVSITGSGRTDTGVHASGQVAHFATDEPIDLHRLMASLNGILPSSVAITQLSPARDSFHARYDAIWRQYRYRISGLPFAIGHDIRWHVKPMPDIEMMNKAAQDLLGTHDFDSFCRTKSETKNRVCTVESAVWVESPSNPGHADFEIRADRFLHGMVRAIVGTLVEIGHGKRDPDCIPSLLEAKDRKAAGYAAPPHGLMLERVGYPGE